MAALLVRHFFGSRDFHAVLARQAEVEHQQLRLGLAHHAFDEPAVPELRAAKGAVFVEPTQVCEVTYLEMTKSTRKMRAPVFLRMRPDKLPEDCDVVFVGWSPVTSPGSPRPPL